MKDAFCVRMEMWLKYVVENKRSDDYAKLSESKKSLLYGIYYTGNCKRRNFFCKIMFRRFFYGTINIIRRTFYYGKTKETGTSSTNDRRKTKHHPSAPGRVWYPVCWRHPGISWGLTPMFGLYAPIFFWVIRWSRDNIWNILCHIFSRHWNKIIEPGNFYFSRCHFLYKTSFYSSSVVFLQYPVPFVAILIAIQA